jgi:hypothetical protein
MIRRLEFAHRPCFCASLSPAALAEVVQTKERTYAVTYKDGAVERFKIVWTADVTATFRQQGGSPVPYQGQRGQLQVLVVDRDDDRAYRLARHAPRPRLPAAGDEQDLQARFPEPRRRRELIVEGERNQSCKDAAAQREGAIAEARAASRALFERLTEADLANLRKETQANPDVASVTVQ